MCISFQFKAIDNMAEAKVKVEKDDEDVFIVEQG